MLAVHLAEVLAPNQFAVEVQAVEAIGAEIGEDMLAVGDGRGRGEAGGDVARLVGNLLVNGLLPEDLARLAAHGEDDELMVESRGEVVMRAGANELGFDGFAEGDRRGEEDVVAPDDRRRMPLAGNRGLPADVLRFAPLSRRLRGGRNTSAERPAPLRPGLIRRGLAVDGVSRGSEQADQDCRPCERSHVRWSVGTVMPLFSLRRLPG